MAYSSSSSSLFRSASALFDAALRHAAALAICIGAGTAAAQTISAQDFSIGIAAGPDRGHVDCVSAFPCDRSNTHFKLTGTYRFADAFDAQIAYFHGGRFEGGDLTPLLHTPFGGTFRVEGIGLTAGYRYTFAPDWSVVGRLGAAEMRTRFAYANALAADVSKTTLQPLAGIGIAYAISPAWRIGIDYDETRFKVYTTRGSLRMLGFAVQFSF